MLEMDDNTLIAMALREHAQTCDGIAARHCAEHRSTWVRRAERCRGLARRYENAAKIERTEATHCTCGPAMQAIGEHNEGCPKRAQS